MLEGEGACIQVYEDYLIVVVLGIQEDVIGRNLP